MWSAFCAVQRAEQPLALMRFRGSHPIVETKASRMWRNPWLEGSDKAETV